MNLKWLWFALFALALSAVADEPTKHFEGVRLNLDASEYARDLVAAGRAVADAKGHWRSNHPSRDQENEFIRKFGFTEYAKWHLGIDDRYGEYTKARYKFPYGDFRNVYRSSLLAVKSRARQFGYSDIEVAADKLLSEEQLNRPKR